MAGNEESLVFRDGYQAFVKFTKLSLSAANSLNVKPVDGMKIYEGWMIKMVMDHLNGVITDGDDFVEESFYTKDGSHSQLEVHLKVEEYEQLMYYKPNCKFCYKVSAYGRGESTFVPLSGTNCLTPKFKKAAGGNFEAEGDCTDFMY